MTPSIKIAAVLSTFNRGELTVQAVHSLLRQDLPAAAELIVVVVDDGSTDNSREILRTHLSSQSRVTVLELPNRERGAARNSGARFAIENLGCNWLYFMDSDDWIPPHSFRSFLSRLESISDTSQLTAIYADIADWDGVHTPHSRKFSTPPPEGDLSLILMRRSLLSIGTVLMKSSSFLAAGGFEESRLLSGSEDWEFWVRLAFEGNIFYSDHVALWYRRHAFNTQAVHFERSMFQAVDYISATLQKKRPHLHKKVLKALRFRVHCALAGTYNSEYRARPAIVHHYRALRVYPQYFLNPHSWRFVASVGTRALKKWVKGIPLRSTP